MSITGSCLCGAVGYEVTGDPAWAHHCHCSRCRKSRGAAFATNVFVPLDGFRFTRGEDQLQSYKVPEAERYTHVFCRNCGSTMPWCVESRGLAIIPMGSLDVDPAMRPRAHIFVESKAPWFPITDDLPQHPQRPG
ncbi:MAG: GFA family protein [Candidatus Binatia bacterium]